MTRLNPHIRIILTILVMTVAIDRGTKIAAADLLRHSPPINCLDGLILLTYTENPGAMLSMGASLPDSQRFWLLTVGNGVLLLSMAAYMLFARSLTPGLNSGLALMVGGGGSNLFDRVMNNGRVVDFVMLNFGPLATGVFNAADVAITAGVILFLIASIRLRSDSPADPA
jgi:signal peptidase II